MARNGGWLESQVMQALPWRRQLTREPEIWSTVHGESRERTSGATPAVVAILLYYGAFIVSQPLAIDVSGIYFTVTQITIVLTCLALLTVPVRMRPDPFFERIRFLLVAYLFVCAGSLLLAGDVTRREFLNLAGLGMNVLWFVLVGNHLSRGVSRRDMRLMLVGILGLTAVPAGAAALELVLRRPLFSSGVMENGLSLTRDLFYLRGTHTDKVDLAHELAMGMFICVSLLSIGKGTRAGRYVAGGVLSATLLAFTWSVSGILGAGVGLSWILVAASRSRKMVVQLLVTGICVGLAGYAFSQSELGKGQRVAYDDKYYLETRDPESSSYRYRATMACLNGIADNPVFGIGYGRQFSYLQDQLSLRKPMSAHSVFSVPLELGLGGAAPFFLVLAFVYNRVWECTRARRASEELKILTLVAIGVSGFMVIIFLAYFFYFDSSLYFIWLSMVVTVSARLRWESREREHGLGRR